MDRSLRTDVRKWPTPRAQDGEKMGTGSLGDKKILWPTPRAIYGEHPGMKDPRHLTGAAQMFPTPMSRDHRSGKASEATAAKNSRPLNEFVEKFPTPRAFMHKDSSTRGKGNLGEVIGGQLNPTWVEWLMGFPLGWTDLRDSETPSSPK